MILRPRSGSQNHFVALRSGVKIRDQIFPFVETLQDFWRRMNVFKYSSAKPISPFLANSLSIPPENIRKHQIF